jgi:hypothetical protein
MMRVRWIDRLTRATVVVHLTTGTSIRGVLLGAYRDSLVLGHATYLGTMDGERVDAPIDGEAIVPREQVAWMQALKEQA